MAGHVMLEMDRGTVATSSIPRATVLRVDRTAKSRRPEVMRPHVSGFKETCRWLNILQN